MALRSYLFTDYPVPSEVSFTTTITILILLVLLGAVTFLSQKQRLKAMVR